jgi:hypothetical protein
MVKVSEEANCKGYAIQLYGYLVIFIHMVTAVLWSEAKVCPLRCCGAAAPDCSAEVRAFACMWGSEQGRHERMAETTRAPIGALVV